VPRGAASLHSCAEIGARQTVSEHALKLGAHRVPAIRLATLMAGSAPQARSVVNQLLERAQVRRQQSRVVLTHREIETLSRGLGGLRERMQIPVHVTRDGDRKRRG
jgi:hypothetical protein